MLIKVRYMDNSNVENHRNECYYCKEYAGLRIGRVYIPRKTLAVLCSPATMEGFYFCGSSLAHHTEIVEYVICVLYNQKLYFRYV